MNIYALAAAIGVTLAAVPAAAQINHRQDRQEDRIARGVRNGSLTPGEAHHLARQQDRIDRAEDRKRASGGHLSYRERRQLQHRQNRASANIYRKKHNYRGY